MNDHKKAWQGVARRYSKSVERKRGISYTKEELASFHKLVEKYSGLEEVPCAILAASPLDRRLALDELSQLAIGPADGSVRIPHSLIRLLILSVKDLHLCRPLYRLVLMVIGKYGWERDEKILVGRLPRAVRLVYTLSLLEGEVYNGGFLQFFTNSSGEYAKEALEDCRLVGATRKARLLEDATKIYRKWKSKNRTPRRAKGLKPRAPQKRSVKANEAICFPELGRFDTAYYRLEKAEPIFGLTEKYIRQHPEECTEAWAAE